MGFNSVFKGLSTDDDNILLAKYQFMMTGSSHVDHIFSNYLLYRI